MIVVPLLLSVATMASPMNVPVGERSLTERGTAQFIIVGTAIIWPTARKRVMKSKPEAVLTRLAEVQAISSRLTSDGDCALRVQGPVSSTRSVDNKIKSIGAL